MERCWKTAPQIVVFISLHATLLLRVESVGSAPWSTVESVGSGIGQTLKGTTEGFGGLHLGNCGLSRRHTGWSGALLVKARLCFGGCRRRHCELGGMAGACCVPEPPGSRLVTNREVERW